MGRIEKVCVAGTGKLAVLCAAYAKEKGMPVALYDMGMKRSVFLEKQAGAAGIPCYYEEPKNVFERLRKEESSLLVVSAINERILPAKVLKKENIRAINLHQSLLPAHPGRNAEAWAIFEQDEKTGITWHDMEEKVDAGKILVQKEIALDTSITAYQLFKLQIECAYEGYREIFVPLIEGSIRGTAQKALGNRRFHYKKDIPGEGVLDLNWNGEKISAFLRAMDYAGLSVLEKPKLVYEGKTYEWKQYEICQRGNEESGMELQNKMLCMTDRDIIIQKETNRIILKNYNSVEETNNGKTDEYFKTIKAGN